MILNVSILHLLQVRTLVYKALSLAAKCPSHDIYISRYLAQNAAI